MPLRHEIDSLESRQNRRALFNDLPVDLTRLTQKQDLVVDRVVVDYDNIGNLVANDLVSFDLMAAFYSNSTERCWRRVEPWVTKERERRGGAPYADSFEKFAIRCVEYNEQKHRAGLEPFKRHVKRTTEKKA